MATPHRSAPGSARCGQAERVSPAVAEGIRAGILVPTFASAVEALVSNALDAHARCISVQVDPRRCSLRVSDDGSGISAADLSLLGSRNATSKLPPTVAAAFLQGSTPGTFGFKGEALHALSHVGTLEVRSCHRALGQPLRTWRKVLGPGNTNTTVQECPNKGCGTSVSLYNIFSSLPVRRRRLLDSVPEAMAEIRRALMCFALASPQTKIELCDGWRNGKVIWEFPGTDTSTRGAFASLFGAAAAAQLEDASSGCGETYQVDALLSQPGLAGLASTTAMQFVFVNGRPAKRLVRIERLINRYYRSALLDHGAKIESLFPMFVLAITCPPDRVKLLDCSPYQSVEFTDWSSLLAAVSAVVETVLARAGPVRAGASGNARKPASRSRGSAGPPRTLTGSHSARSRFFKLCPSTANDERRCSTGVEIFVKEEARLGVFPSPLSEQSEPASQPEREAMPPSARDQPDASCDGTTCDDATYSVDMWQAHSLKRGRPAPAPKLACGHGVWPGQSVKEGVKLSRDMLAQARVVAQVGAKFVIVRVNDRLLCVDQHAADERVRLESFERSLRSEEPPRFLGSHALEHPVRIPLSPEQWNALDRAGKAIARWNFGTQQTLRESGEVLVTNVPTLFGVPLLAGDLEETLEQIAQVPHALNHALPPAVRRSIVTRACHGAIKFGDLLTIPQCERLVESLAACDFPFQCAHGRPTCCPLASLPPTSRRATLEPRAAVRRRRISS